MAIDQNEISRFTVLQWDQERLAKAGKEQVECAARLLGFDVNVLHKPDQSDPTNGNVYIVLRVRPENIVDEDDYRATPILAANRIIKNGRTHLSRD
jgi:hypothetical protein